MSSIHPYEIKEIYPGQYHMMLDFPDVEDILKIISTEYNYIWFYDCTSCCVNWHKVDSVSFETPLKDILIRNVHFECIIETERIQEIEPYMKGGFHMVQLNKLPPPYLRMDSKQIDDRTKHEMLSKLEYILHVFIPGNDYGWIVSPDLEYLKGIAEKLR